MIFLPLNQVLRALRKKMKKIDGLITKQKSGVELDEQQLASIETLNEIIDQIQEFTSTQKNKA
jgi:uncharacterized protein with WD repeat